MCNNHSGNALTPKEPRLDDRQGARQGPGRRPLQGSPTAPPPPHTYMCHTVMHHILKRTVANHDKYTRHSVPGPLCPRKVVFYEPAALKGLELPKKGKFPFRETNFGVGVDKAASRPLISLSSLVDVVEGLRSADSHTHTHTHACAHRLMPFGIPTVPLQPFLSIEPTEPQILSQNP